MAARLLDLTLFSFLLRRPGALRSRNNDFVKVSNPPHPHTRCPCVPHDAVLEIYLAPLPEVVFNTLGIWFLGASHQSALRIWNDDHLEPDPRRLLDDLQAFNLRTV